VRADRGGIDVKRMMFSTISAAVAVTLLLAGCGGGGGQSGSNAANSANGNNGGGSSGGTLIYGRGGDSVALDPANVTDGESFRVTHQIYETLIAFKPGSFQLTPDLATGWHLSDGGKKLTLNLRKGVKFQDGTPFNADAVVFNFDRWWDKSNPYHKGSFEYFPAMFGGFKGDPGCVIKDVKKVDDYTVEIDLNRPMAPILADLAMDAFAIASPASIKKYHGNISEHPVGTGPFEFVSWKRNDQIVLEKNPHYWQAGLPKLDKVIFEVIPDNKARLNALQSGQIDIMDGLNPSDYQTAKSDPNLKVYLRPSNDVGYLAFNTQKKPFNDPRVRQAISMVIDKAAIVKAYYNGLGQPANQVLPKTIPGYDDSIQPYPVDVAKAKKLLAEAGYPNGFKTQLWAMTIPRSYFPQPDKVAAAIQADLKKININAQIVTYEWATYLDKLSKGEHTMALAGWIGDNGDPDDFLYVLLDKDNAKVPAQNYAFYKSDKLHQVLIAAQKETNSSKRIALYQQAEQIIRDDAPWVPIVHTTPPVVTSTKVSGFVANPVTTDDLKDVSLNR
jgi:peptide/nickel transport system substrate-binding protein